MYSKMVKKTFSIALSILLTFCLLVSGFNGFGTGVYAAETGMSGSARSAAQPAFDQIDYLSDEDAKAFLTFLFGNKLKKEVEESLFYQLVRGELEGDADEIVIASYFISILNQTVALNITILDSKLEEIERILRIEAEDYINGDVPYIEIIEGEVIDEAFSIFLPIGSGDIEDILIALNGIAAITGLVEQARLAYFQEYVNTRSEYDNETYFDMLMEAFYLQKGFQFDRPQADRWGEFCYQLDQAYFAYAEQVEDTDENTYTVTFRDWNQTTLKTELVESSHAATAPKNPTREGHTFTGWDKDFSNVTGDLTVTTLYSLIDGEPLPGSAEALVKTINEYGYGDSDITNNCTAVAEGNIVTVTGEMNAYTLELNIGEGVTVKWGAKITDAPGSVTALMHLIGKGTFELIANGVIDATTGSHSNTALTTYEYGFIVGEQVPTIKINGGEIHAEEEAISTYGDIFMDEGKIYIDEGTGVRAIFGRGTGSTIVIHNSTLSVAGEESDVIVVDGHKSTVSITDCTISASGDDSVAIATYGTDNVVTVSNSIINAEGWGILTDYNCKVTINDSEMTAGSVILVNYDNASIEVNNSTLDSSDYAVVAIQGKNTTITINESDLRATGESGRAISSNPTDDGTKTFINGGSLTTQHYTAIDLSGDGDTVTISGGAMIASGDDHWTIHVGDNSEVIVHDGMVQSYGRSPAIRTGKNSNVEILGDRVYVYAEDSRVIDVDTNSTVTVDGGAVFAIGYYERNIKDVIYIHDGNFTGPNAEGGVVLAWNTSAGTTNYTQGTTDDLIALPANSAKWNKVGGIDGISWQNGENAGFIPVPDISVTSTGSTENPQSQTVTFPTVTGNQVNAAYGDKMTHAASSTGIGTIRYSSSDTSVATVNDSGTLTIQKTGMATITATAAAVGEQWLEASASYTLHVSPATITVTADNKTITQGGALPTPTVSYTGFVAPDNEASIIATQAAAKLNVTDGSLVGTSTIDFATEATLQSTATNYILDHKSGTLTVQATNPTGSSNNGSGKNSSSNSVTVLASAGDGSVSLVGNRSGESVTLSVPDAIVKEIINTANDNEAVIDISKQTNATEVTMPKTALMQLANANLDIALKLPQGTIILDPDAIASTVEQSDAVNISASMQSVSHDSLTSNQQLAVNAGDLVLNVTVSSGDQAIHNFDGTLTITAPYTGELPVSVWYLDDNGSLEKLICTYDEKAKTVSFTTNHLSLYVIGKDGGTNSKDAVLPITSAVPVNPFQDVTESDWFIDHVIYVYDNRLMNSTNTNPMLFSPHVSLTRAMAVTVLYNTAGAPDVTALANPYTDVPADTWYTDAVKWAAAHNVMTGVGESRFVPDMKITREQTATMFMNYMKYANTNIIVTQQYIIFADEDAIADYAKNALQTLNKLGVINGKGSNTIAPKDMTTRAEFAAILRNFIEITQMSVPDFDLTE